LKYVFFFFPGASLQYDPRPPPCSSPVETFGAGRNLFLFKLGIRGSLFYSASRSTPWYQFTPFSSLMDEESLFLLSSLSDHLNRQGCSPVSDDGFFSQALPPHPYPSLTSARNSSTPPPHLILLIPKVDRWRPGLLRILIPPRPIFSLFSLAINPRTLFLSLFFDPPR